MAEFTGKFDYSLIEPANMLFRVLLWSRADYCWYGAIVEELL